MVFSGQQDILNANVLITFDIRLKPVVTIQELNHNLASPLMTSLTNLNASTANVIMFFSLSAPSPSISRVNVPLSVDTASATYPLQRPVSHTTAWNLIHVLHSRFPILRLTTRSGPGSTTLAHS